MPVFEMKDDNGLWNAHGLGLNDGIIEDLVRKTSSHVTSNELGSAPSNFGKKTVKKGKTVQVKNIWSKTKLDEETQKEITTEVEFKSGFRMIERAGVQQKWEGNAISGDFRLDLQNIENGYANFSVQTNGENSKTIAKCMMQVGKSFGQRHLVWALRKSRAQTKTCYLTFG